MKMPFIWTKFHIGIVRPTPNMSVYHGVSVGFSSQNCRILPYLYLNSHQDGSSTLPLCVRQCISSFSINPMTSAEVKLNP